MKAHLLGACAMAVLPCAAAAVGLDRSHQPVDILFQDGNYAELSFGRIMPSLTGTDLPVFGGRDTGNVADDYSLFATGVKFDVSPALSFAIIADEPYGSDIVYPDATATDGSIALGGTRAKVESTAITALARYKFSDRVSVHGGLRYQVLSADVMLSGAAYGPLSGYRGAFDGADALGYVIGAAYEIPEIALRAALTFNSEIDHELPTRESVGGAPVSAGTETEVTTPQSLQLDLQTGVAPGTLIFANVRYAWYSETIVSPQFFDSVLPGDRDSLVNIDSGYDVTLGVGRQLTDKLSGSIAVGYQQRADDLVSPLRPIGDERSVRLGLSYDVTEALTISGGLRYVVLGDTFAETGTPDTARAEFEDNDAVAIGLRVGYRF